MKKNILLISIMLIFSIMLTACKPKIDSESEISSFITNIESIKETEISHYIIVENNRESFSISVMKENNDFTIVDKDENIIGVDKLKIGQEIEVTIKGSILTTCPGTFNVQKVKLIK